MTKTACAWVLIALCLVGMVASALYSGAWHRGYAAGVGDTTARIYLERR